jgi:four helix bundle protein
MSRDHRKLRVFVLADRLVIELYQASARFPSSERYGLQAQVRRAAVSVATNIVEGAMRRTDKDYVRFLDIVAGSAAETSYLVDLAGRLDFLAPRDRERLEAGYNHLCASLIALINSLKDART